MEKMVISLFVGVIVMVCGLLLHAYYMSRKINKGLEKFYKIVDILRNDIHRANSLAEARELLNDIESFRGIFDGEVSKLVMNKEFSLLESLVYKKMKKLR